MKKGIHYFHIKYTLSFNKHVTKYEVGIFVSPALLKL